MKLPCSWPLVYSKEKGRHMGSTWAGTFCGRPSFFKEIENNADNVDAILEGAYSHPAFRADGLLGMLMGMAADKGTHPVVAD